VQQLRRRPDSRQAVVQILRSDDLVSGQKDVPCTVAIQFVVRDGAVSAVTFMRSNDALWGLSHDIFAFTMLQELVACDLGLDVGPYVHHVGSLHLYDTGLDEAQAFLDEGLQPTDQAMPAMPNGSQREHVEALLHAESLLRGGCDPADVELPVNPYWRDLAVMLAVREAIRHDRNTAIALMEQFSDPFYRVFVEDRLGRSEGAA
jgi:thymidylate synthase